MRLALTLLLIPAALAAQNATITFSGRVTDALTGQGVAGASVRLLASGGEKITTTGMDGSYAVPDLEVGTYLVSVRSAGYAPAAHAGGEPFLQ